MNFWTTFLIEVSLLTASYWMIDSLIRNEGYLNVARKIFKVSNRVLVSIPFFLAFGLSFIWDWSNAANIGSVEIKLLLMGICAFLNWQALTKDVDPVLQQRYRFEKSLLMLSFSGMWFSPAFGIANVFLLTYPFAIWQHHATLPMRISQLILSFLILGVLPFDAFGLSIFKGIESFIFMLMVMQSSHYFITALAKSFLGPKWYSWMFENKLHHMAASSYSWGWARFIPWNKWKKVIRGAEKAEKPMQIFAYGIEVLAPLALLHPYSAMGFSLAWAGFHTGVFSLSGLLFWDWILTDIFIVAFLWTLPLNAIAPAFGWPLLLLGLVYMVLFPLRHKLWKPMPLGWYDTPFTQRVHWRVKGESGKWYGLYNNFMCPHERLYGKVNGCFMVPEPVLTYHLGECWKPELRDRIRKLMEPDADVAEELKSIKEDFGVWPTCGKRKENHRLYLEAFFAQLNNGFDKSALPKALKWLKAPGDQLFYWGEYDPYKGQEKVSEVELSYREEIFRNGELERITDEVLETYAIPEAVSSESISSVRELTPKEIDDFLLEHAKGRLIDLPGYKQKYLKGDDGKVIFKEKVVT